MSDNFENRSQRANIPSHGLPEASGPKNIIPTLVGIFREILELPYTVPNKIDWAHRALRPPSQDADNPRDVICKLHKYILMGLHTLMQRWALHPLLAAIQEVGLTYRWGFPPGYLQVTKEG